MATLLQTKTSLFPEGRSSQLADQFVARWRAAHPNGEVIVRDLTREPVPHLTAERFAAFATPPHARSPEQVQAAAYSDTLIDEIQRADTIVLGLPMYNFGVPSTLKAYFDHIARAGVTFRYTEGGAEGLVTGKRVYVFAARGGIYLGTPLDTQSAYVRHFLGFLGMRDIELVYAEGLNLGEAQRDAALATATATVDSLAV